MRFGLFLVIVAFLLGAVPASAQESPSIVPTPDGAQASKERIKRRPIHAKRAAPRIAPRTAAKSVARQRLVKVPLPKPATAKTVATKLPAPKPAAIRTAAAKANEPKIKTEKPAIIKLPVSKPAALSSPIPKPAPVSATAAAEAAPKADRAEPTSDAFAGIPAAEKRKIQAALLWAGDYPKERSGEDPQVAAIKSFQKRHKDKVTGELTSSERALLVAAAKAHEADFGWTVVVDPATGIRIGLPGKLVPFAHDTAHGTRWSSAHGEVQVETFRIKETKLAALFEQEKKQPPTRKVESSTLRDDGFSISGRQGLKLFSVRAKLRDGEVRGYTLLYDQMMETIVEQVAGAMASAFSAFPERSAPYAALAKSVEYGNGLVVSEQGHIVTDRALTEGCQVLVASGFGDAERIAADDSGLALLRVYAPRQFTPVALTRARPRSGELTLVGIPEPREQDGRRALTEVKARLGGGAVELRQPVPMAGFSGAAALDAHGQFVGMMQMGTAVLASIEAAAPPVRLVSAETIRGFLAAHGVETAATSAADARASIVRIICVRK